jgi:hypothetical protein
MARPAAGGTSKAGSRVRLRGRTRIATLEFQEREMTVEVGDIQPWVRAIAEYNRNPHFQQVVTLALCAQKNPSGKNTRAEPNQDDHSSTCRNFEERKFYLPPDILQKIYHFLPKFKKITPEDATTFVTSFAKNSLNWDTLWPDRDDEDRGGTPSANFLRHLVDPIRDIDKWMMLAETCAFLLDDEVTLPGKTSASSDGITNAEGKSSR